MLIYTKCYEKKIQNLRNTYLNKIKYIYLTCTNTNIKYTNSNKYKDKKYHIFYFDDTDDICLYFHFSDVNNFFPKSLNILKSSHILKY